MIRNTCLALPIAVILVCLVLCGPVFAANSTLSEIRVVTDYNYPPYTFHDSNGNMQGIAVDQWHLFEQKTGIHVIITGLPWDEAQTRLLAGNFDVIETMGYTDERARSYDFLPAYSRVDVPIFFSKDIPGISGPDSLAGFVVAVQSGDSAIPILLTHNVTSLREYATYEDIIRDAKAGSIHVFCMDRPSALYFMNKYDITSEFRTTQPLYSTNVHRAVRKGSSLLPVISEGFGRISPGEYRAIEDKWLGTPLVDPGLLQYALLFSLIVALLVSGLGIWVFTLRRAVSARTRELQDELERRRITEGELARANQTLQLFGRLLQEEIKTSLFALRGYLSLIPPAESDISAQKSLESSRQLAASLEEIVDSVRYLRETGEKKQEWVDISQAFLYARSHHKITGITFKTDINGLEVFAEPIFESLFSILIGDSLHFGRTVDRITLSRRAENDRVILVYSDNGTGVPASDKKRIFIRPEDGGSGHRLAVVREILLITEMTITETGVPGQGIQFEITVPQGKFRFPQEKNYG
jgi:ABC-type amino acid transport substrate-binding protein